VLLDRQTLEIVALSAAGVALLCLLLLLALMVRFRKLGQAHLALTGGDAGETFVASVSRQQREAEGLRTEVGKLRDDLAAARADLSDALRHVSVVRYDAFGDMGGCRSARRCSTTPATASSSPPSTAAPRPAPTPRA
jgi:hypothetical protein